MCSWNETRCRRCHGLIQRVIRTRCRGSTVHGPGNARYTVAGTRLELCDVCEDNDSGYGSR